MHKVRRPLIQPALPDVKLYISNINNIIVILLDYCLFNDRNLTFLSLDCAAMQPRIQAEIPDHPRQARTGVGNDKALLVNRQSNLSHHFFSLFPRLSTIVSVVPVITIVTFVIITMVQHKSLRLIAIAIQVLQRFLNGIHGMETVIQYNKCQIH